MAKNRQLRCELVTPDRLVLDTEATSVVFPAHDGEMGVLRNRAPLLCKLGIGICRITAGDQTRRYYIDGGFARVLDNRLTILTQDARSSEEIDTEAARRQLASPPAGTDPAAQEHRRRVIQRASAQLRLARG